MKISYRGDYALKVILDLSNNYSERLVHIEDMANRQDIPRKFLEQILLELKKGGFIQSKKGANGGYFLAKPPKEILLGEVIRFIEGTTYPISCIDPNAPKTCGEINRCVFYPIWQEIGSKVTSMVDNINFEQLKENDSKIKKKNAITYHI
ncbi:MAG: Rrf2 family transcriptional regulator [Nitrospinota bacterium]|nr:Rrf2 family transcriptional regulator [Nitrospinota bacterium]